jgi:hypothetical protein
MNLKQIHDLARWHSSYSEFKSAVDKRFNGTPETAVDNTKYELVEIGYELNEAKTDSEGYDLDDNGNRLSCCGTPLDPDYMICSECREHC